MSTKNTDIDNVQETPPRASGSFYTETTTQGEMMSPTGNIPPPRDHLAAREVIGWRLPR